MKNKKREVCAACKKKFRGENETDITLPDRPTYTEVMNMMQQHFENMTPESINVGKDGQLYCDRCYDEDYYPRYYGFTRSDWVKGVAGYDVEGNRIHQEVHKKFLKPRTEGVPQSGEENIN
jgi:hypothetical protein